jgi:nicotinate-nucleotide adenylyltransferase
MMDHPRVLITDIEVRMGTRFTADTLAQLRARYRGVRFVWLMGSDNLIHFHRWDDWRWIMETTPIAIFARPENQLRAVASVAARRYGRFRLPSRSARLVAQGTAPCWSLLTGPMSDASSTRIRATGGWP